MNAHVINKAEITITGDREVRVERIFNASRERVWRAFTDPTQIAQWWGRGNRLTIEKFECVRGGHWRFIEHTDHGDFGFEGRYREVTPMDRIIRSFEWDGMPAHVAIEQSEFIDLGDGRTKIVGTLLFHTVAERDGMLESGMEAGMNQSHAALDALLTSSS
jgi:uncharacterized protein YndB with AHSA1/START domain